MDYYTAPLPLQPVVPGYLCQPSPTQTAAVPTIVPTHDLAILKQPPCTLIANAYAGGPLAVVHLPATLLQTLQRAPFQYDPSKDLVATCSQCGQKNTLWELRMKELINCLKEEYALKCYLRKEIRFESFPGEELQLAANNIAYPQTADLCKISNLRANANEFTPGQRNPKIEVANMKKYDTSVANIASDECEIQHGRLKAGELGVESSFQDSGVSDSGNQDSTTIESISESCIPNDGVISTQGSTESLLRSDNSGVAKRKNRRNKHKLKENRPNDLDSVSPTDYHQSKLKLMDNNRNYKHNEDANLVNKKDRNLGNGQYGVIECDLSQSIKMSPGRPNSRGSDYKKGSTNGQERRHNGYVEEKRVPARMNQPPHVHVKNKSYDRSKRPTEYNDHGSDVHIGREPKYLYNRHISNANHVKKSPRKSNELSPSSSFIHEIEADLFTADEDCSLANCVTEDFRMAVGIGLQFKKHFVGVGELLDQQKTVGEVAYLERAGRFIFYLITKKLNYMKPTVEVVQRVLRNLRKLCEELKVKKLAMPPLAFGERLRWDDIKQMLIDEFGQTDTELFIHHCKEEETVANVEGSPASKTKLQVKICEVPYPLVNIENDTAMVVYGALDGTVEKANEQLNVKYPYLEEFSKRCQLGLTENFLSIYTNREYVCVLIVRNVRYEPFSFTKLEHSVRKFNKFLKENEYRYVGIDRIADDSDTLINNKIISVFRSNLITSVDLYVCNSPKKSEYQSSNLKPTNSYYNNTNSTASSN